MNIKNIFLVLLVLIYTVVPVMAADEGVKKYDANGSEVPVKGVSTGGSSSDNQVSQTDNTKNSESSDEFFGIHKGSAELADVVKLPVEGVKYLSGVPILWNGSQALSGIVTSLGAIVAICGIWYCLIRMGLAARLKKAVEEILHYRHVMNEIGIGFITALLLTGLIFFVSGMKIFS
jgi:hypothetical protein